MQAYIVSWGVLAMIVLFLAIYRKTLVSHEDVMIHLAAGQEDVPQHQVEMTNKLAVIDRWGKALTVLLVLYGLGICYVAVSTVWESQKTAGM